MTISDILNATCEAVSMIIRKSLKAFLLHFIKEYSNNFNDRRRFYVDERANKISLYRIYCYFGIWHHSVQAEICCHCVTCIVTGPQLLPKQFFQNMRSSASSFKFQHLPFSLRLFTSYLCLLPRIPAPSIFLSITFKLVSITNLMHNFFIP